MRGHWITESGAEANEGGRQRLESDHADTGERREGQGKCAVMRADVEIRAGGEQRVMESELVHEASLP